MRRYVFGEYLEPKTKRRLLDLIQLCKQRRWRMDIMPCLAENVRFARESVTNRPLETLVAFRLMDQLDTGAFLRDREFPTFDVSPASLRDEAVRDLDEMIARTYTRTHERRQRGIYA
jgi:hypothetical protein